MNDLQRTRVQSAANTEVVRRMLIKYFIDRNFTESFDKAINPVLIQDLPLVNTGLDTKIEIEPHAIEIDPTTGRAVLGWNLFVLGNQRIFLGETHHQNLMELARQIKQGQVLPESITTTRRCTTPRRIITFIERTLSARAGGYVDLTQRQRLSTHSPRSFRSIWSTGTQDSKFLTRAFGTS